MVNSFRDAKIRRPFVMEKAALKNEFDKHMRSRECEKPSMEMLFELFVEGYKLGDAKTVSIRRDQPDSESIPKRDKKSPSRDADGKW